MERDKIISVRHFLNKRLKYKEDRKGNKYYTPYMTITYHGKSNQFVFNWEPYFEIEPYENRFTEEEWKEIKNEPENKDLFDEIQIVTSLAIPFEMEKYGAKFTMKGFSKRLNFYLRCFSCVWGISIRQDLENIFRKEVTTRRFFNLIDKIELLNILEIIDYVKKKYVPDLEELISKNLKHDIQAYFLLAAFIEENEAKESYYHWIFGKGFDEFNEFVSMEKYSSNEKLKQNILRLGKVEKAEIYSKRLKAFIDHETRDMENDHYYSFL